MKHLASPQFWEHYQILPVVIRHLADKNFELLKQNPQHREYEKILKEKVR